MQLQTPRTLDEERLGKRRELFARAYRRWQFLDEKDRRFLNRLRARFNKFGHMGRFDEDKLLDLVERANG